MVVVPLADLTNDVPVLGPIGVGVGTLGTVWSDILAADPQRRGVIFANPGTNNLYVAPSNLGSQPANGAGAILIWPQTEFELFTQSEHQNVNAAWKGWVDTGSNQPVSILDFTGTNQSVPAPAPLSSLRQGSVISSPVATGATVGTSPAAVIGANAQRRGISFHNPYTIPLSVFPSNLSVAYGVAGGIIILPGATKTIIAQPSSRIRVNCGWSAAAESAGAQLTMLEYLG